MEAAAKPEVALDLEDPGPVFVHLLARLVGVGPAGSSGQTKVYRSERPAKEKVGDNESGKDRLGAAFWPHLMV